MPASDHVNPYQLKLFMQAHELMDTESGDANYNTLRQSTQTHDRKLEESKMNWEDYNNNHYLGWTPDSGDHNLYESVQKKGVQKPVELYLDSNMGQYRPIIADGNHRTAVANDINPNMYLPVTYHPFKIKD